MSKLELVQIEYELRRINDHYQAIEEWEKKKAEFFKEYGITSYNDFNYYDRPSIDRYKYDRLVKSEPKRTNATIKRSLMRIRELALEYDKKL